MLTMNQVVQCSKIQEMRAVYTITKRFCSYLEELDREVDEIIVDIFGGYCFEVCSVSAQIS